MWPAYCWIHCKLRTEGHAERLWGDHVSDDTFYIQSRHGLVLLACVYTPYRLLAKENKYTLFSLKIFDLMLTITIHVKSPFLWPLVLKILCTTTLSNWKNNLVIFEYIPFSFPDSHNKWANQKWSTHVSLSLIVFFCNLCINLNDAFTFEVVPPFFYSNMTSITLMKLAPFAWYAISVQSHTCTATGPFSKPVIIQTKEGSKWDSLSSNCVKYSVRL